MRQPQALVADECGNIFELPPYLMAGQSGYSVVLPHKKNCIPLPKGSDLFVLPDRHPIVFDPEIMNFRILDEFDGKPIFAVAAFLAPAYVQMFRSAYKTNAGAPELPLYSYTSVGWSENTFAVPAWRVDPDPRQDLKNVNLTLIEKNAHDMVKRFPTNRLVRHLVDNCVFRYGCPAARNFVMQRWEYPVPVSPGCNANCYGCLSLQKKEKTIVSPMQRIAFVPTVAEIVEYTVPHLARDKRAVISFGQGCEGEPLLQDELLIEAISQIRKKTNRGIINLNTNASRPDIVEKLCSAGLDSIRVSLNSAQEMLYNRYFNPQNYTFDDVLQSMDVMRKYNRWISLNYFVFPGLTDIPSEINALEKILEGRIVNMIQMRNMNVDPEQYMTLLKLKDVGEQGCGMFQWRKYFVKNYPGLLLGYFNPPREVMKENGHEGGR